MKSDLTQELDRSKNLSNRAYEPIRNISNLSPYHERVTIEKRYLQKKEKLRSILIMGHLQKMQLNAINNRSIETMRKTKVAEGMSKKRYQSVDQQEISTSKVQLKIDNRKQRKKNIKTQMNQIVSNQDNQSNKIQQAYEKLIDDYLKQVSKDKLLEKGMDRKKIIEEACDIIKSQMNQKIAQFNHLPKSQYLEKQQKKTTSQKRTLTTSQQNIQLPSIQQFPSLNKISPQKSDRYLQISTRSNAKSLERRKKHQTTMLKVKPSPSNKSVVEIEFYQNLKQLKNEQNYLSKQRMREEKLFLRKMKLIGMKHHSSLRSSLKEH